MRLQLPRGARAHALMIGAGLASSCLGQLCQPSWSTQFPGGDFDGPVRAYAVFDSGTTGGPALYAGGTFTRAGGVHAAGVARWTGSAWQQVGGDFDGDVNALCAHDDGTGPHLFAGGTFRNVGGTPILVVARLDGSTWVRVGPGIYGVGVHSMISFTDSTGRGLFVGGELLGTSPAPFGQGVMVCRGNSWSGSLPSGGELDMRVHAMAIYTEPAGATLYATGRARQANGMNIARYRQGWSTLGSGQRLDGAGFAAAAYGTGANTALYVGGDFQHAGGVAASRVARWNGTSWGAVGAGIDGPVRAMLPMDVDGPFGPLPYSLYVGGAFTSAGGVAAANIAVWNGGGWVPAGAGANDAVLALGPHRLGPVPALFAGGHFSQAGGLAASHAAAFTGSAWQGLANPEPGNAPSDRVRCVAWFDEDGPGPRPARLFIGGEFRSIGAQSIRYIASWDGASWSSVGGGTDGPVTAFKVFDDGSGESLFVAGQFAVAGGVPATRVARLRDGQWSALGAGLNGVVLALESYAPAGQPARLYAGGSIAVSGFSDLAQWNGTIWTGIALPSGVFQVDALAAHDDGSGPMLYAATPGSTLVRRWNGSSWSNASAGLSAAASTMPALLVFDDGSGPALYGGGGELFFGTSTDNVGRFRNGSWTPLVGGPNGWVTSLAGFDDGSGPALYAGGAFTTVGGAPAQHLAGYRAGVWGAAGDVRPAATASVQAMTPVDPDGTGPAPGSLWIGGSFLTAAGVSSPNVARLAACSSCYANCDGSTASPVLNVGDFVCFQQRFAAGEPYANCDASTKPPVLNVGDFVCFQQRFAAGCP